MRRAMLGSASHAKAAPDERPDRDVLDSHGVFQAGQPQARGQGHAQVLRVVLRRVRDRGRLHPAAYLKTQAAADVLPSGACGEGAGAASTTRGSASFHTPASAGTRPASPTATPITTFTPR